MADKDSWEADREWVLKTLARLETKLDKLTEGHWRLYAKVAGISAVVGLAASLVVKFL